MIEQTKRISFRISFVLSKVELKPGAGAGPSHWLRLRPTKTYRLRNTAPGAIQILTAQT